ncbi:hypothetical protein kam1_2005 [Methylacidiphilum kamchatkense Kam1]|uniref:Uncharacterized protein n=1 Tax=Methylacidiphilum kamchatkense Kam1 TaxID=1202785 RepID=A0A516TPR8_9BACT|nr:hypothetical protein kam1_2005 [Methylacidiphilum kamchatkense Kam1]
MLFTCYSNEVLTNDKRLRYEWKGIKKENKLKTFIHTINPLKAYNERSFFSKELVGRTLS